MKRHIEIVKDDEVAIDVIPLVTNPPVIVEYKIDKDGMMGYFKLIRADGSSKRYSSMINMLQSIDREDLETWKLVKAKHENTRPEEDYKRVLWGGGLLGLKKDFKMILRVTTAQSVVKPGTIRTVLSLAASRHWPVHQLDVKNAFLHGDLSKTVYMHQPLGFRDSSHPNYVCLLQRSLYGLKQAPHLLHRIISSLHLEFAMTDLGSLNYFLGISVARDSSGCFYLRRSDAVVSLNGLGDVVSDPTMYQSLAGSLQYLTFTRPDNCHIMDSGSSGQRNYQAESDQKDKMRHAMDDNGIPSKEIHERHRERAITAEEALDDTKPLQYVPKSQTDQ
ncbi:ribonuclease H-like domain-containing protein [Tanacetum coccineum]